MHQQDWLIYRVNKWVTEHSGKGRLLGWWMFGIDEGRPLSYGGVALLATRLRVMKVEHCFRGFQLVFDAIKRLIQAVGD
jgi:hypothetical protein